MINILAFLIGAYYGWSLYIRVTIYLLNKKLDCIKKEKEALEKQINDDRQSKTYIIAIMGNHKQESQQLIEIVHKQITHVKNYIKN